MANTFRNSIHQKNRYYRRPKTFNEIRQLHALETDIQMNEFEYPISKRNRMHRHIPDAWEDIPISAWYEIPSLDILN